MENMIIRKATLDDIHECALLRIEFLKLMDKNASDDLDKALYANLKQYYSDEMNRSSLSIFLSCIDDKIIGSSFVSYYTLPPRYANMTGKNAYVANVYVREEYRGKGIARKLMECAIEDAKSKGCPSISLNATDMGKPLYLAMNFKQNDENMTLKLSK